MNSKIWSVPTKLTSFKLNMIMMDNESIVLDALKISEDSDNDLILRIHESKGSVQICNIYSEFEMINVQPANIIEDSITSDALLSWTSSSIKVKIRPFQILTLKISI